MIWGRGAEDLPALAAALALDGMIAGPLLDAVDPVGRLVLVPSAACKKESSNFVTVYPLIIIIIIIVIAFYHRPITGPSPPLPHR
jgi:hypothetical protein